MPHPPEKIRFCTSRDGTRIAYSTCGSGPPLVWIAHWVRHLKFDWDDAVWRPWLSVLSRRHTLISFDWRGCGLSDQEGIEFSFDKYVEDLEAIIAAAGLDEPFVILAMGGLGSNGLGVNYAARHPDRVSRLVLCGPSTRGVIARAKTSEQVREAETRLNAIELGWPKDKPAYGQFFASLHMPDANAEQFRSFHELLRRTTSPSNAGGLLRTFMHGDVLESLPRVRCPTLVLHARQDAMIPFDEGRLVASLIPDARFIPLESRNHILLDTEPAWRQFVEALDDFLPAPSSGAAASFDTLTARERDIAEFVAQGLDNNEIAVRLRISEKTIRNQISILFSKLGVANRGQLIVRAREAGFGHRT